MLNFIRKKKNTFFGVFLAVVMAMLMIPFGATMRGCNRGLSSSQSRQVAARVAGEEISMSEFKNKRDQLVRTMHQQYGKAFEQIRSFINIDQRTIDSLIDQRLLRKELDRFGITASNKQIESRLLSLPVFAGRYSEAAFKNFLQAQGISAEQMESEMRFDLSREQLQLAFRDLSRPSDVELKAVYAGEKTAYNFRYLELPAADFTAKVNTADEQALAAWFAEHKEHYKMPGSVKYSYIKLNPQDYAAKVDVNADDISNYYDQHGIQFTEPKQLKLRKLLLKKAPPTPPNTEKLQSEPDKNEAQKKKAQDLLARLKNGENFTELAKANSEDGATAPTGGDLGWLAANAVPLAYSRAVSTMVSGEFSQVIDAQEGYVILFLDEVKDARKKPLDEVKGEIETLLRRSDAPVYALDAAQTMLDRWTQAGEQKTIQDLAKENNLNVSSSNGLLPKGQDPEPDLKGITDKALALGEGARDVAKLGDFTVIIQVEQVKPAYIPELAEVRDKVINDYREAQSKVLAKAFAEDLLKEAGAINAEQLPDHSALAKAAAAHQLAVKETGETTKDKASAPVFTASGAVGQAFHLSESNRLAKQVFEGPKAFYLIELTSKKAPDLSDWDKERTNLAAEEMQAAGERALAALIAVLRAQTEIWVNPIVLERAKEDRQPS